MNKKGKGGIKMNKTYKVAIKRASNGGWTIKNTKDLNSFIRDMLDKHKTILLNVDSKCLDYYPHKLNETTLKPIVEEVDLAITIADFYLG